MKKISVALVFAALAFSAMPSMAATEWSTSDYDLTPGDFNGDGRTDLLYIARSPGKQSGIALSNGTTAVPGHQSWSSGEWGIPWLSDTYKAVVCDFNNDGKDDVFLQRQTSGQHFVLLTNTTGRLSGASQGLNNDHLDPVLDWSAVGHRILCGDFNGDGYDDLFLQATRATDRSAVVLADTAGLFTQAGQLLGGPSGPRQWWVDGYLSTNWSLQKAVVHVGKFNADSRSDLFVQAKPSWVIIDFDVSFPVPVYPPKSFRFFNSRSGSCSPSTSLFCVGADQSFDRNELGVDVSAAATAITVADVNGDGYSDLLVQSLNSASTVGRVLAGTSGVFSNSSAQALSLGGVSDVGAGNYRVIAGNFDGVGGSGAYLQAQSPASDNFLAQDMSSSTSVSVVALDAYSFATPAVPATTVGALGVKAAVGVSGNASLTIPIVVPPGIAGVQPDLAFVYDSTGANGPIGMGWSIDGLAAITRCPRTVAQDGSHGPVTLTSADRFCLGGSKLRLVSGIYGALNSTYRSELDYTTLVTVTAVNPGGWPTTFEARTKEAIIMRFGGTSDSQLEPAGSSVPYTWYASESSDFAGNKMTFGYTEDRSNPAFVSHLPNEIVYASNASAGLSALARVQFVYEARADVQVGYAAGAKFKIAQRLNAVETYFRDNGASSYYLVKRYGVGYQAPSPATSRSRVAYIQECAPAACMPETKFTYQDGTAGWATFAVTTADTALGSTHTVDINGDGREDLVYPQGASWRYALATAPGAAIGYQTPVNSSIVNTNYDKSISFDWDGNGLRELLVPISSQIHRIYWNGSTLVKVNTGLSWTTDDRWRAADVNGDGLEDLIIVRKCPAVCVKARMNSVSGLSSTEVTLWTHASHNAFGTYGDIRTDRFWDFNGDGRHDYLLWTNQNGCGSNCPNTQRWNVLVSNGTSMSTLFDYNAPNLMPWIGDFNGDGLSDILYIPATNVWTLRFGTGSGVTGEFSTGIVAPTIYQNADSTIVVDYDGDGRQDVLTKYNNDWYYMRSDGETLQAPVRLYNWTNGNLQATDVNGDGLTDLGFDRGTCGVTGTCWAFGTRLGVRADILVQSEDGFGLQNQFTLFPLTGSTSYTKGSSAAYPELDYTGAMMMVTRHTQSDGVGGTPYVDYTYSGARLDLRGRGFLGFQKRTATDSITGLKTEETFHQTFPHTGMLASSIVWQPSPNQTKKVSETTNTPAVRNISTVTNEERYFPYLSPVVSKNYNVTSTATNGNLISQVTTAVAYDDYGNKTSSTETVQDGVTGQQWITEVTNPSITNNSATWCVGKVTQREERRAIPGESLTTNAARVQSFNWDTTLCRLDDETVQPGDALMSVLTAYQYDTTGNRTRTTVTGAGMTPRVSIVEYGANRMFPMNTTNAVTLGVSAVHTTAASWNFPHAAKSWVMDASGQVTNTYHDSFGRKRREVLPDGTARVWNHFSCNANNSYCGDATGRSRAYIYEQFLATNGMPIRYAVTYTDMHGRKVFASSQTVTGAESGVRYTYNSRGQLYKQSAPYLVGVDSSYDTTINYDIVGRKIREDRRVDENNSANQVSFLSYDMLTTTATDAQNKISKSTKYATGMLKSVTQTTGQMSATPVDIVTNYEYDGWGNPVKITDHMGNEFKAKFNIRGFRYETTDPDMGVWSFTPNALGDIVSQTDAKNQTTTMSYDELGRMYNRVEAEGTTVWNWDVLAGQGTLGALRSSTITTPQGDNWYTEQFTYDSLGRPLDQTTSIEGTSYTTTTGYDPTTGYKNSITYPVSTSGVRARIETGYTYGILSRMTNATTGTVLWRADAANSRNAITVSTLGNGLSTRSTYDKVTGWLRNRKTGINGGAGVQNLAFEWDNVGNLYTRTDTNQAITETFIYDDLHRLDSWSIPGVSSDVAINAIGNVTSLTGAGAYEYTGAMSGCSYYAHTQPHAVRRTGGSTVYCYDANGNMARRGNDNITWYSFNLPNQMNQGSSSAQFRYGPKRQRVKQVAVSAATGTETTYYLPEGLERVTKPSGVVEWKHNIATGDSTNVLYTRRSDGSNVTHYTHADHIGSVDALTNESGATLVRLSYAAYGKRRNRLGWNGPIPAADQAVVNAVGHRGFTSHEMLDNVELIHMNGRVYDPVTGRFISADPVLQEPSDPQTLNRYSYVRNNPLSFVDPSGLSFFRTWGPTIVSLFTGNWYINLMARHVAYSQTPGKSISGWIINVAGPSLVQPVASSMVGATGFKPYSGNIAVETVRGGLTAGVSSGLLAEWGGGQFWDAFGSAAAFGAVQTFYIAANNPSSFAGGPDAEGVVLGAGYTADLVQGETVLIVNGINTDRKGMLERIEVTKGPAYWNKTDNFFVDLAEVIGQKLGGKYGDPVAAGLARYVNSLPPGAQFRIIAHSGGTATVANAIRYYGMDIRGKTIEMRSPAVSKWYASKLVSGAGGTLEFKLVTFDIANVFSPNSNVFKAASGFGDIAIMFMRHISTFKAKTLPAPVYKPTGVVGPRD